MNDKWRGLSLLTLFDAQSAYQQVITNMKLPKDDLPWFSYHVQAMVEELGELMKSDKRWKTHRNTNYDPINKMEEIADCFVTLINISLYSGFNAEQIWDAIFSKISQNNDKLWGCIIDDNNSRGCR